MCRPGPHVGLERGAERERVRVAGSEARLEHPGALEEVVRSISQVNPMPPSTCTAVRPLAIRRRRRAASRCSPRSRCRRRGRRRRSRRPRRSRSRASSTRTYMSASRCLTAWNEPIGTPNWCRSSAYADATSSAPCATPTSCAAASTVPAGATAGHPPARRAGAVRQVGTRASASADRAARRPRARGAPTRERLDAVVVEDEDESLSAACSMTNGARGPRCGRCR